MSMGTPARLTPPRNHVGILIQGCKRLIDELLDFVVGVVVNAEAILDRGSDEIRLLCVRGRREEVFCVFEGEAFGRVCDICESGGEPYVLGVACVEF